MKRAGGAGININEDAGIHHGGTRMITPTIGFTLGPLWRQRMRGEDLLEAMWDRGCRSVEIYLNPFDEDYPNALALARHAMDRGCALTVHAATDGDFNAVRYRTHPEDVMRAHRLLLDAVENLAANYGQTVMINFHGGQGEGDRGELVECVRLLVHRLADLMQEEYPHLRGAIEILPHDPQFQRIGDREEDLLRISEGLDISRFGLCWDMGHLQVNQSRYNYGGPASDTFVERVVHTHVHEVDHAYHDHCPLGRGVVSVRSNIERLVRRGYKGVFNLELGYKEASLYGDPLEGLFSSAEALSHMLGSIRDNV